MQDQIMKSADMEAKMPNGIILTKGATGWNARYVGPHVAALVRLFGTDTIPTAFTLQAAAPDVVAAISAMNPGVTISTARESR